MSSLPQERVDAGPSKATLLVKPGLVFVADRKSQCIGGAGRFRGWWPLPLHKPKQCVNARARNLVPARTGTSTTTLPEQRDRIAQISLHLGFGHIRDQDISPRKMVEETARISTIVSYHHRAVLLADQYGFELGNQFAIGFRHQWLLCWSNDRRGSPENNAEQIPRRTAGSCGFHALLRIMVT